ncbi:MAG TPA: hypothetical protein VF519_03125 [Mycobacteriales bacterium]|jgi:hypothetical protein
MRRLLPLLIVAVLAPPALALPGLPALPGCTLPALPPNASALEGNGYVRVAPGGTASWVVNGARWASWHGTHVAYWMDPVDVTAPTLLCVDGLPVATGSRAQHEDLGRVAWSPDGTRLAYVDGGVLEVRTGSAVATLGTGAEAFAWSPASDALLVRESGRSTVRRLDGTTVDLGPTSENAVWGGGRVFSRGDWTLVGDEYVPEVVSVLPDGTDRQVHGTGEFVVSADGTRIALLGADGFQVVGLDGTDHGSATVANLWGLEFSPDATQVAFMSGTTVNAWDGTTVTARPTPRPAYYVHWVGNELWWNEQGTGGAMALVHEGTVVATGAFPYDLDLVRIEAGGGYLVEVERMPGLPTTG